MVGEKGTNISFCFLQEKNKIANIPCCCKDLNRNTDSTFWEKYSKNNVTLNKVSCRKKLWYNIKRRFVIFVSRSCVGRLVCHLLWKILSEPRNMDVKWQKQKKTKAYFSMMHLPSFKNVKKNRLIHHCMFCFLGKYIVKIMPPIYNSNMYLYNVSKYTYNYHLNSIVHKYTTEALND